MGYIHGFSPEEQERLVRQNDILSAYIYRNIGLESHRHIVEVGCGVGAQMLTLLTRFPDLVMTGIEMDPRQLRRAEALLGGYPSLDGRYHLLEGDAAEDRFRFDVPVDGALLVWVLEHVPDPLRLLQNIRGWLPKGCPLWATEVNHPSFQLWPESPAVMNYWSQTLHAQLSLGGDPAVGLKLGNLLHAAGFDRIATWPQVFFLDRTRPEERQRLMAYWLDLMRSALHESLAAGFTTLDNWRSAETEMRHRMAAGDTVFSYSFIQAMGIVPDQKSP